MASVSDNERFKDALFEKYLLDNAIEWIASNLAPEDVFDKDQLEKWAKENDFVEKED